MRIEVDGLPEVPPPLWKEGDVECGPLYQTELAPAVLIVPIPEGFAYDEALQRLAALLVQLLSSGMPEREIAKRLMRYHPAVEG